MKQLKICCVNVCTSCSLNQKSLLDLQTFYKMLINTNYQKEKEINEKVNLFKSCKGLK